jgi:hypothetical protein
MILRPFDLLTYVLLVATLRVSGILAQNDRFIQTVVSCGGNTTTMNITGYVTIEQINLDMKVEFEQIRSGRPSQEPYIFVLCPNTVFDLSIVPLQPILSGSVFTCGIMGNVALNCEFRGGSDQIVLDASNLTNYNVLSVNFIGITHTGFANSVLSGTANAVTTVDITRSAFRSFAANAVILQSNKNGIAPLKVQISDSTFTNATGRGNIFVNIGGELSLVDVSLDSSSVMSFVTTGSSNTTEGSTFLRNVTVMKSDVMVSLESTKPCSFFLPGNFSYSSLLFFHSCRMYSLLCRPRTLMQWMLL